MLPLAAGAGFKPQHAQQVLSAGHGVGFFEVHAENYMVDGGPLLHQLEQVRSHYEISLHGVGLSIGGEGPLDDAHLERLSALVRRFEPAQFSEHLAWSSHGGVFYNDLLPLPYNQQTLQRVCAHVDQVQDRLGRRMLLENPSTYFEFEASTLGEAQFIAEVVRRTGCGLLLDVNNAHVACANRGADALAYIDALPLGAVGEVHLAGFSRDADASGEVLLIDDHGSPVAREVWRLYEAVIERLGPVPTLVEWDNDVPAFEVLAAEARRAALAMHAAEGALA